MSTAKRLVIPLALGAWLGRHHRNLLGIIAGLLVSLEIGVVAAVQGHSLLPRPFYFSWGVSDWTPYVVECAVGVGLLSFSIAWNRGWLASLHRSRST